MLYIGIGNAGSKVLRFVRNLTFVEAAQADDLNDVKFMVGDADSNNSVVYEVREKGLHEIDAPKAIKLLRLDRFWSGGCGVYHTIGELLTETAEDKHVLTGEIEAFAGPDHATLLIAAGGGTGGGVGGALARRLASHPTRNVRVFAILPETDQFRSGNLEISGPDSFQCASAGRFLTKFLNDYFRVPAGGNAPKQDLFILSNSYLTCLPAGVAFRDAVDGINRFLFNTLTLMPDVIDYGARQRLVTFGQSWAQWPPAGGSSRDPAALGVHLVKTALSPLDLRQQVPSGLSALPMDLTTYEQAFPQLFPPAGKSAGATGAAETLRLLFQKCRHVDAWIYTKAGFTHDDQEQLRAAVQGQLEQLFGARVNAVHIANRPLPGRALPGNADAALLVLVDMLPVEEVFRLATYFIQSAFQWSDGSVTSVARKLDQLLLDPNLRPPKNSQEDAILKAITIPPCALDSSHAQEIYTDHFWGNVDDLKNKVLQSLDRSEDDYMQKFLRADAVAGALWCLRGQIWRDVDVF